LVALMVDGVHFGEHRCVVALGIDIDGIKHPLALVEGSTENTTLVTDLLVGLRERGLDVTRPILVVIDGAQALRRAVRQVFDRPVIQRCQLHPRRMPRSMLNELASLPRLPPASHRGRCGANHVVTGSPSRQMFTPGWPHRVV
jgi:putative transposase